MKYNVGLQQRRLTLGAVVRGNLAEMRKSASKVLSKARLGQDAVSEFNSTPWIVEADEASKDRKFWMAGDGQQFIGACH